MNKPFRLIVTDTSPLFTLVLADALDVLLRPGFPVSIPDAVYIEATRVRGAPGADRIVEWINAHFDMVRIVPTDIGIDQQRRIEEGRSTRGLGEQAALETLERFLLTDATAEALLLFEDSDLEKRRAIVDERVSLIGTGDSRELEPHSIESAGLRSRSSRVSRPQCATTASRHRGRPHARAVARAASAPRCARPEILSNYSIG